MIVAIVLAVGSAIVLLFGRSAMQLDADLNQDAIGSTKRMGTAVSDACSEIEALRIQLADARSQAVHLEGEVAAMTLERDSWRERAQVAIHVAQGPQRTIYAPRCECAECRHVRGG